MPLAQKLPGLRRFEIVQGPEALQNDEFHLVATLHFDDADAASWAMASPEGLAADADRRRFVSDGDLLTFLVDGYESDLQNPAGDFDHLVS